MKNLKIEKTKKSPLIDLNYTTKTANFEGRSIHSDGFEFYVPVIRWIEEYDNNELKINFKFEHINTITNKCILQILLDLKKKVDTGSQISVLWYYDKEDEDMMETGEELELLCGVKMEFKIIEE